MVNESISKIVEGKKPIVFDCLKDKAEKPLKYIANADIIYIGELHGWDTHNIAEIEIISVTAKRYKIQIALEEFNTNKQQGIDEYLNGGAAKDFLKESDKFSLLKYAYKNRWKIIAIDIPPEKEEKKNGWDPEWIMTGREKYWEEILSPHLNKEIKTFVIVGQAHLRKYSGFNIRLARAGWRDYVIILLK